MPECSDPRTRPLSRLVDLALNRPVSASSVQREEFPAGAANDGDSTTRWSSGWLDGQWWQVDLGGSPTIDRVEINWEGAYASRYRILTSTDGTTFSLAASEQIVAAGLRTTTFSPREARYVRLEADQRATSFGVSFFDFRVFGFSAPPPQDTSPPDTAITSGPTGTTTSTSASFQFNATEPGSTFQCRLDNGTWSDCTSPKDHTNLTTGNHTFEVRATDPAGNTDQTPATRTWTINPPAQPSGDLALNRPVSASSVQREEFPAGAANDGDSTTRWSSGWLDGQWWQVDLGGSPTIDRVEINWEGAYASRYRILTSTDGTTFSLAASEQIVAAGLRTTTFSPREARYVRLEADQRATSFGVSFFDFRVFGFSAPPPQDTSPPDTAITSGPTGTTTSTSASFQFNATEPGSTFQCRLDNGTWSDCTSPKDHTNLTTGNHTFEVRATDPAGNTDQTPATRTWTINRRPLRPARTGQPSSARTG